jgi:hypothetical protein
MTTLLYLMACLMSPSHLSNLAESRDNISMPFSSGEYFGRFATGQFFKPL